MDTLDDTSQETGSRRSASGPSSLASTPSNSDESLLSLDGGYVRYRKPNLYARFLAQYPWVIVIISGSLGLGSVLLCALVIPLPSFDDPVKGFDTCGTDINAKSITMKNLYHTAQTQNGLSFSPKFTSSATRAAQSSSKDRVERSVPPPSKGCHNQQIDKRMLKVVFESTSPDGDLFNVQSFRSICAIESVVISPSLRGHHRACNYSTSLPLYAMLRTGKQCQALTQADVDSLKDLLSYCYPFFQSGALKHCQDSGSVCLAPRNCTKDDISFNTLTYLVDSEFDPTRSHKLQYTLLLYNINPPDLTKYFMDNFADKSITHGRVTVASVYGTDNSKFDLFSEYFLDDMMKYIVGAALGCILAILLLYLFSVVLLLATLLTVGFSFAFAYAIYYYIFQIKFFPFINILAGLILIAIGADDVFIFFDAWKHAKKDDEQIPLENRIARTFNHAAMSVMVTSLTTAGSFFANYVTGIISIRCFAIFAGTAVFANFFFMITWIPAVIVYQKQIMTFFSKRLKIPTSPQWYDDILAIRGKISDLIFIQVIPKIVEKCWHVCILVLLGLGIGGLFVVFYSPRLQVPVSSEFPLFPPSQYMEKWDKGIRDHFRFTHNAQERSNLSVRFVWGLVPQSNGVWYDHDDLGTLQFDQQFDPFSPESQVWLKNICNVTQRQDIFVPNGYGQYCHTFFEMFEKFLEECDGTRQFDEFCCKTRKMPFSKSYLDQCYIKILKHLSHRGLNPSMITQPVFDPKNNIKAFLVHLQTNHPFSTSYHEMESLYLNITGYFKSLIANAPVGLENGFVSNRWGEFEFYDLQRTLATGTRMSILLSLGVATILMLVTSLNLLLTIYAMFTITLAISVTIGCLVLMGWHLNIVESITISLAVGLSIDFTIHYGVSYRLSKEYQSQFRTRESFQRVGSAVVMAAATTFVAGLAMMPSHILAYIQLGTFMMLVMTFSWIYATFFFQSLCHVFGPKGNFCQVPVPCKKSGLEENYDDREPHRSLQLQDPTVPLGNIEYEGLEDDEEYLLPA